MHGVLQRLFSIPAVDVPGMNAATCRSGCLAASALALTVLLLSPAHLSSAQRDLEVLHDSVRRIADPAQLRAMIAERRAAHAETSPDLLTERGLLSWRLYELTAEQPAGKAAQKDFERALRQAPDYGWAHYGLGLALANGPASPLHDGSRNSFVLDDVVARAFGKDAPARARRAFLNAVRGRPPVPHAAAELAEISTDRWNEQALARSAAALHELNSSAHATADSWLAAARVQLELDDDAEAAASVERALALGAERGAAAYTRALLLLRETRTTEAGARAWLESVDHADEEGLDQLLTDLSALLTETDVKNWSTMDPAARRVYLRDFWTVRAALSGVTVPERLAEHYHRLAYARKHYYRSARFGVPTQNHLVWDAFADRPYDDRGAIFIRHGRPRDLIRATGVDAGRETWIYEDIDGQPRVMHFAAMRSQADYDLVYTPPCAADYVRNSQQRELVRLSAHCLAYAGEIASTNYRAAAREFLRTDSQPLNFTKDLPFYFDLYTFRGHAGRTSVVAAVAVPVEKLQKSVAALHPAYRIDLSLILVDTASRKVIRQDDSVAITATRAFKNDDLFRMHVEVAVPPSRTTVQRVIVSDPSEPGIGQLYGGPFLIPDYGAPKLMLSDVVLAEPRVEGRWRRGDVALALVPTGRFKGGSFRVFYEIYNIEKNTAYSTEIEIEPLQRSAGRKLKELFGAAKRGISLKFDGVALDVRDGALQELRQVEAPLPPGKYRMRITVRTADGATARGERLFVVPDE